MKRYLREEEINLRWRIAILTILYMGLRRGRFGGFEWKDIDFENGTIKMYRSVQKLPTFGIIIKEPDEEISKRTISMPDKLFEYLHAYEAWWLNRKHCLCDRLGDTDRLFWTEEGKGICLGLLRVWIPKSLARAGLPIVTLHSLRHTNITLQLMAGIDIKTVAGRVGHSQTSTTTDIYSHFLQSSDKKASNILDKIFE